MKWWPGWDFTKSPFDRGQICDLRTYGGVFRYCVFLVPWLWVAWHVDDFFVWEGLIDEVNPREQQWHRFGVIGLAIVGYGGALLSVMAIFLRRRRERRIRKSAEGQWYDRADLTREELYGSASDAPESDGEGGPPASVGGNGGRPRF